MQKLCVWLGKSVSWTVNCAVRRPVGSGKRIARLVGALALACLVSAGQAAPTGQLVATGYGSDLAILGPGYFVLHDPVSGLTEFTRQGEFSIDVGGFLVNNLGMRVQGYADVGLTQLGDVQINPAGLSWIESFLIQSNGQVIAGLSDGSEVLCGQILLQSFAWPDALKPYPYGMFTGTAAAGPWPQLLAPGAGGLGSVAAGEIEIPVPRLALSRVKPPVAASASITNQGVLTSTGIQSDLAIEGPGYFMVRDTNSGTIYATRAGAFYVDAQGYLVNYAGMRVQGYSDAGLTTRGDVCLNLDGTDYAPGTVMTWYNIDWSGVISVTGGDGASYLRGQILLTQCARPDQLVRTNLGLYAMSAAAGPWTVVTAPAIPGAVQIFSGWAELNQFDQAILDLRQRLNFFNPTPIISTTNQDDLGIMGMGFFTLRDPLKNVFYATQQGHFHLDAGSWLVDANGFRVQGYRDGSLTNAGDIRIDANPASTNSDGAMVSSYIIGSDGVIVVNLADDTSLVRGQVLLQNYADLQALVPVSTVLYSNITAALPIYTPGKVASDGMGTIESGSLNEMTPPVMLQLPPQSGWRLSISSLATGANIQASSDLQHWTTVAQVAGGVMQDTEYFDTNAEVGPGKFYRAELVY